MKGMINTCLLLEMCLSVCIPARGQGGGVESSFATLIQVCAAQWGCDFGTPDLKWGIHI